MIGESYRGMDSYTAEKCVDEYSSHVDDLADTDHEFCVVTTYLANTGFFLREMRRISCCLTVCSFPFPPIPES